VTCYFFFLISSKRSWVQLRGITIANIKHSIAISIVIGTLPDSANKIPPTIMNKAQALKILVIIISPLGD
jgi:hypothetical protein